MTSEDAIAPADPADRPPRFRWRLLPTLGCGLFGGLSLLGAVLAVAVSAAAVSRLPGTAFREDFLLSSAANGTGGACWVAAAVLWWKGRWRWAAALSAAGAAWFWAGSAVSSFS